MYLLADNCLSGPTEQQNTETTAVANTETTAVANKNIITLDKCEAAIKNVYSYTPEFHCVKCGDKVFEYFQFNIDHLFLNVVDWRIILDAIPEKVFAQYSVQTELRRRILEHASTHYKSTILTDFWSYLKEFAGYKDTIITYNEIEYKFFMYGFQALLCGLKADVYSLANVGDFCRNLNISLKEINVCMMELLNAKFNLSEEDVSLFNAYFKIETSRQTRFVIEYMVHIRNKIRIDRRCYAYGRTVREYCLSVENGNQ